MRLFHETTFAATQIYQTGKQSVSVSEQTSCSNAYIPTCTAMLHGSSKECGRTGTTKSSGRHHHNDALAHLVCRQTGLLTAKGDVCACSIVCVCAYVASLHVVCCTSAGISCKVLMLSPTAAASVGESQAAAISPKFCARCCREPGRACHSW